MVDYVIAPSALHHKAHNLLTLLEALNQSGSRLEDEFWEKQLGQMIKSLFSDTNSTILEELLDYLALTEQPDLYDILANSIESLAETAVIRHQNDDYTILLVTAPITSWTRYQLPNGALNNSQHDELLSLMKSYVSNQAKVAVLGQLLSFEQLPKNVAQTHKLCVQLGQLALDAKTASIEIDQSDDGINLLADAKFIVAAIAVPMGAEVFSWQETSDPITAKQQAEQRWQKQCEHILASMFTGCQSQYLPPNGYFHNSRESDKQMRPLAINAAVQWLATITDSALDDITATIARCGEEDTEEFRIGLSVEASPNILYGCVWPIFSKDEIDVSSPNYQDTPLILQNILTDLGVESIRFLAGLYEPEFCEDCHAPSFPNTDGELQHPHLPGNLDLSPTAIH